MTELWRRAASDRGSRPDRDSVDDRATRMLAAELDALMAEAQGLPTLIQKLQRPGATAEKSFADARALVARREATLEEERSRRDTPEVFRSETRAEKAAPLQ
jgi:hypothetical protein